MSNRYPYYVHGPSLSGLDRPRMLWNSVLICYPKFRLFARKGLQCGKGIQTDCSSRKLRNKYSNLPSIGYQTPGINSDNRLSFELTSRLSVLAEQGSISDSISSFQVSLFCSSSAYCFHHATFRSPMLSPSHVILLPDFLNPTPFPKFLKAVLWTSHDLL